MASNFEVSTEERPDAEYTTFTVEAQMRSRWVPHFLAMLRYMQHLGDVGSSRTVSFFSDGDGDFRPKFDWNEGIPSDADPVFEKNGNRTYDAG